MKRSIEINTMHQGFTTIFEANRVDEIIQALPADLQLRAYEKFYSVYLTTMDYASEVTRSALANSNESKEAKDMHRARYPGYRLVVRK